MKDVYTIFYLLLQILCSAYTSHFPLTYVWCLQGTLITCPLSCFCDTHFAYHSLPAISSSLGTHVFFGYMSIKSTGEQPFGNWYTHAGITYCVLNVWVHFTYYCYMAKLRYIKYRYVTFIFFKAAGDCWFSSPPLRKRKALQSKLQKIDYAHKD